MRVLIDNNEQAFATVDELFNALRLLIEDNQNDQRAISISLTEAPDGPMLEGIAAFLSSADNNHCHFSRLLGSTEDSRILGDLQLHSHRDAQDRILAEVNRTEDFGTYASANIRSTKVNLVNGIQSRTISIQHQHQQQQQQQQVTTTQIKRRPVRKKKSSLEPDHWTPLSSAESLGVLVDRSNLEALCHDPQNPRALLLIWDNLVGEDVDRVSDYHRKITHVQQAAMFKIIEHADAFSYGIVPENLPTGFYLQEVTTPGMQVLCYDEAFAQRVKHEVNPLKVQLTPRPKPLTPGSFHTLLTYVLKPEPQDLIALLEGNRDLLKTHCPDYSHYQRHFETLYEPTATARQHQQALQFFLEKLSVNRPERLVRINAFLEQNQANDALLQGLGRVLIHAGIEALDLFILRLRALQNTGNFLHVQHFFLTHPDAFVHMASEENLHLLKQLAALNDTQKSWWESLLNQHVDASGYADFPILFKAWLYFLAELKKMGLTRLPLICPLQPIKNLQTALDRALFLIKTAASHEEQLSCLANLDFGPSGAYQAASLDHYDLMTVDMQLSRKPAQTEISQDGSFKVPPRQTLFATMAIISAEHAMLLYYRYLGTQSISSIETFRDIAQLTNEYAVLESADKNALLALAALLAPQIEDTDKPLDAWNDFIQNLIDLANPEPIINTISSFRYLYRLEQLPSLQQLNRLLVLLKDTRTVKIRNQSIRRFISACPAIPDLQSDLDSFLSVFETRTELAHQGLHHGYYLLTLDNYFESISKIFKNLPISNTLKSYWIKLMPFFGMVFVEKARDLLMTLSYFEPKKYLFELLDILLTINIASSESMLHQDSLRLMLNEIDTRNNPIPPGKQARSRYFAAIIQAINPELVTGNNPVRLIEINPLKDLKDFVVNARLRSGLTFLKTSNYPPVPTLRFFNKTELKTLKAFLKLVEREDVTLANILQFLPKVEKAFFSLANSKILLPLLPLASKIYNDLMAHPEIARQSPTLAQISLSELLNNSSLLFLIKDPMDMQYKSLMRYNLIKLNNRSVEGRLLNQCPTLDLTGNYTMEEKINRFQAALDQYNLMIRELLQIKAKNPGIFRALLQILDDGDYITLLMSHLSIREITTLLATLNDHPLDLTVQLLIIIEEMSHVAPNETSQRDMVFNELISLVSNYNLITNPDAYLSLLRLSLHHNLRHDIRFPVQEILAIKGLTNLSDTQSEQLFQQLLRMIKDTPNEVAPHLPDLINQINQSLTQAASMAPLISNLLRTVQTFSFEALESLSNILGSAPETEPDRSHWICILQGCGASLLSEKQAIKNQLMQHPEMLAEIASLYRFKPYPTRARLEAILNDNEPNLAHYLQGFDQDPHDKRSSQAILDEQFSYARIAPVVSELAELHGAVFPRSECYILAQELTYLTTIGRNHALQIGDSICPNLITATRTELREYFQTLILLLRQPAIDSKIERRNQLHLLAVMRELYFRSTGKFPYTSQMLVPLLALHDPANLLLQINTGQGKSITTALQAVLQWGLQGGTVNVLTANTGLITKDYEKEGSDAFFRALDIPSTKLFANSEANTRCIGGINYTTISDLSLYNQRARLEGEALNVMINGKPAPVHLIIDESDFSILDNRIFFNLAMPSNDKDDNAYAWIYPLLNRFVDLNEFRNISQHAWSRRVDIQELKLFLLSQAEDDKQRAQLAEISDSHYNRWIDAACEAANLVEGRDYIVQDSLQEIDGSERRVYSCVPLIANNPCPGNTFTHGAQQCLHAREQVKKPLNHFPLIPELDISSSESAKNLLDQYLELGTLIGLSGSPAGTLSERLEQQAHFDFHSVLVPPHNAGQRIHKGTSVAATSEVHNARIIQEIENNIAEHGAGNLQPTLMLCKDINQARAMHENLKALAEKHQIRLQLVTGEESTEAPDPNSKSDLQLKIREARNSNVITIATSLLGRGTDIKPRHPEGLWVIQTYMDTERGQIQNIGRANRDGHIGRYTNIYYVNDLPYYSDIRGLEKMSAKDQALHLKTLGKRLNEEHAVERYFTQQVSGINQLIMTELNQWQSHMSENGGDGVNAAFKKLLLRDRKEFISLLNDLWYEELQDSDPDNRYPNRFVRRDANNRLVTEALHQALTNYRTKAIDAWTRLVQEKLLVRANGLNMSKINQFRTSMLASVDMTEQMNAHHLKFRQEKRRLRDENRATLLSLEYALNPEAALLNLGDIKTQEETDALAQAAATAQLQLAIRQFNQLIQEAQITTSQRAELTIGDTEGVDNQELMSILANQFMAWQQSASHHLADQIKLQPLIQTYLHIADTIKNPTDTAFQEKLDELKAASLDTLTPKLEEDLAWANPDNPTWEFKMERSQIQIGARQVLADIRELKSAGPEQKPQRLKVLYQTLQIQQLKLDSVWSLALGHRDIRKAIGDSLRLIDNTSLPEPYREEAREQAVYSVYWDKVATTIRNLETNHHSEWLSIIDKVKTLGQTTPGIHVFKQCLHYLNQEKSKAQQTLRSPLLKPIQTLINRLTQINNTLTDKHLDLVTNNHFLTQKCTQLEVKLRNTSGIELQNISLRAGHTGFNEYYELRLEAKVTDPQCLPGFTFYQGLTANKLQALRDTLESEAASTKLRERHGALKELCDTTIPNAQRAQQINRTPTPIAASSTTILSELTENDCKLPEDNPLLAQFAVEIREYNHLVENLTKSGLLYKNKELKNRKDTFDLLSKIRDLEQERLIDQKPLSLKIYQTASIIGKKENEMRNLLAQIMRLKNENIAIQTAPKKSLLTNLRIAKKQTKIEILEKTYREYEQKHNLSDYKNAYAALVEQKMNEINDTWRARLNTKTTTILSSINQGYQELTAEVASLDHKIAELDTLIESEQKKMTLVGRRFESLDELLEFETGLLASRVLIMEEKPRVNDLQL